MAKTNAIDEIAERVVRALEEGTAPWIKPWDAPPMLPFNPVSGTRYRGANFVNLATAMRGDPRWMTYKQAQGIGAQVRKGERSTAIIYWKTHQETRRKDESGETVTIKGDKLSRPMLLTSRVFNAEQIDGLEPLIDTRDKAPLPLIDAAEAYVAASGAKIVNDGGERAYYRPSTDSIHLPVREAFKSEGLYYATALHELGHWTGHPSRLDRDLSGGFGSESYAQEELRAELYSYMMSAELQLPHDPSNHLSYVAGWIKAIKEDPMTIHRAARDAGQIVDYVAALAETQTIAQPIDKTPAVNKDEPLTPAMEIPTVRIDPVAEFTAAARDMGLVIEGSAIMDGEMHRVPVEKNGKTSNRDGAYVGYLDGRPAGYIKNHHTGEERRWKAEGRLNANQRKQLADNRERHQAERAAARETRARIAAEYAREHLAALPDATPDHPYCIEKGIGLSPGVKLEDSGRHKNLVVPLHDTKSVVQGFQRIGIKGFKLLAPGMAKAGNHHMIGTPKDGEPILIAEGYATGMSLFEATGRPVAVAIDAGNLSSVARAVQAAYTEAALFIAGDDDRSKTQNIGRLKAEEAARAVGGRALYPQASAKDRGKSLDFNDMANAQGRGAVKAFIEAGIAKGRAREDRQIDAQDSPKVGMKV